MSDHFLLMKRGLYYRPDNAGYTGIKSQAGRYPESRAMPEAGITAIHEDEAPEYSECCAWDIRLKDQVSELSNALEVTIQLASALLSPQIYAGGRYLDVKQEIEAARAALVKARGEHLKPEDV